MPKDYSFGVVPFYKEKNGQISYLVIQQKAGHWGFPKGHREGDETDLQAAEREFTEETSVTDFKIVDNEICFTESYVAFHPELEKVDKTVCYFLAQVFNKEVKVQSSELIDFGWFLYDDAIQRLSHPQIKSILKSATEHILKDV